MRDFLKFYLDHLDEIVTEVGYITLPDDVKQAQYARLEPFLDAQPPEP